MSRLHHTSVTETTMRFVISGTGNLSLGVYRVLYRHLRKKIDAGTARLIIIAESGHHLCYGWMPECINEVLSLEDISLSVDECFAGAEYIYGKAVSVNPATNEIQVLAATGDILNIGYDHLVFENSYFTDELADNKGTHGFGIQSGLDMLKTSRQLNYLASIAAAAPNKISAAKTLTVTIGGEGTAGIDLAVAIATYLRNLCSQSESLQTVKPTIYLVANNNFFENGSGVFPKMRKNLRQEIREFGVKIVEGKQVTRVNSDGATLSDGSFINCSLVYSTSGEIRTNQAATRPFSFQQKKLISIDEYFRLSGSANIWLKQIPGKASPQVLPSSANYVHNLVDGKFIGENILRSISGRQPGACNKKYPAFFGNICSSKGFGVFAGIPFSGWPSWLLRLIVLVAYSPRGLRKKVFRKLAGTIFTSPHPAFRYRIAGKNSFAGSKHAGVNHEGFVAHGYKRLPTI